MSATDASSEKTRQPGMNRTRAGLPLRLKTNTAQRVGPCTRERGAGSVSDPPRLRLTM